MARSPTLDETPSVSALLQAHTVLGSLPTASRERLAPLALIVRYASGATLFRSGFPADALFAIVSGRVRLSVTEQGRTRVLHWEEAGGLIGEVPCFDGGVYVATAAAMTPVIALRLSRDGIVRDIAAQSPLGAVLLTRMAARARMLAARLGEATSQPVAVRLDTYLRARARCAGGDHFSLGMTQQALAEELGTVREVLVRELSRLRQSGVLLVHSRGRFRLTKASGVTQRVSRPPVR